MAEVARWSEVATVGSGWCVRISAGVCVGVCEGRAKNENLLGNK